MALTKSDLDGQFILCQDAGLVPPGWNCREKSGWYLATHPSLPVVDILDVHDALLGWVLGYAISLETCLLSEKVVFDIYAKDHDQYGEQFEDHLYSLGGRWAGILLVEGMERVYLDPGSSLAAVYAVDEPIIASTVSLFPLENYEKDEELIQVVGFPKSDVGFPVGLTPRKGIRRLLPNHYLDLSKGESIRHWPRDMQLAIDSNVEEGVKKIVWLIKNNLRAVAGQYDLHMSLTAGRDSRVLLACAHEIADKVVFFTFKDEKLTTDSQIAGLIARRLRLQHRFLPVEYATEVEKEDWLYRTGYSASGRIWEIHPTLWQLEKNRALLPGVCGELGRAYYFREGDENRSSYDSEDLLWRARYPVSNRLVQAMDEWLFEVSPYPNHVIQDLLFIEIRTGSRGGPQQYGADDWFVCHLWPFCHRQIFDLMIRLPVDYRIEKRLSEDICRLEWPELLEFPFNEYYGYTKYVKRFDRFFRENYYQGRRRVNRTIIKLGLFPRVALLTSG